MGRPWPKGVSGNPGGRPKGIAAKARALTNDGAEALDLLHEAMCDPAQPMKLRLDAARELLDRGFGRSVQTTEAAENEPELTAGMTRGEKVALLAQLRGMLAEREALSRAVEGEAVAVEEGEVVGGPAARL